MAEALIAGAALGAVFGELLKLVIDTIQQPMEFKPLLTGFERTLKTIEPSFVDIDKLSNRPADERATLRDLLDDGKKLVLKCSSICSLNKKKRKYTKELTKLDNNLCKFFHIEASAATLAGINALLDRNRPFESCGVPELPEFIIGLDQHLAILKHMLLKDTTRVLVVSAPPGFGKTTLANMLCHDDDIKGEFGDNILYLTVSAEASLMSLAKSLFIHYGINNYEIRSEQDAKNQIKNLIKRRGSGQVLLVLDDVWPESRIQDLMLPTPGFKILATSRFLFKQFNPTTYELNLLSRERAKALFCYHAFAGGSSPVNSVQDDLIDKMVAFCKRIPLALIVVGASLCNEPEVTWTSTLMQSILESHQQLLLCLRTSIDALSELHKDCFLDLSLFPEVDQIAGTTLMDMWVELYHLDDGGVRASGNLNILKSKNLVNLVPVRKEAGEPEGHCIHYRVTQHDMLRELAIHLSRQESEADRKRLFVKIPSNDFPEWWAQRPIIARVLSISTDDKFSSTWNDDPNAPNVEVLILNIKSENYTLPEFIKKMSKLKVLIVTGYGVYPTQLNNLQVLESLSNVHRIRFEYVSVSPFIQAIFTLKTLKKLNLVMCKIGDALSSGTTKYPYTLENLKYLEIDLCYDLKELPAVLCNSVRLEKLVITNCQELDSLPNEVGNLSNLEIVSLHCCTKLKELPESIKSLRKLRILDVSDCSDITALPEQIGKLSSLQAIDISGCKGLEMLPQSLAGLDKLKNVACDEERSHLWKCIESHPGKVKMNLVEEDRSETFKKIYH
ncbi:putative disease resistance protein At5g66900 [Bidens hawaiensis]|uniref:putative disease resistance protein At5g66900 n=1 Tax=Bidens hawaiensis TaxID=980011 RepID=UPI00404A8850